ncbi:MAG: hemerythrin family protein [Chloroflexi bacterium]|nr:hemerythrin family protein [Chloroflexota bacterium]
MEKVIWDDSFSVGVRELDEQHKKLIAMLNTLIEAGNVDVKSEIVSDTLMKMSEYAKVHFTTEEEYMLSFGYPEYDVQKQQHREFKKKTAFTAFDTTEHQPSVPMELVLFLKDWLTNHILISDMKYRSFFEKKGVV